MAFLPSYYAPNLSMCKEYVILRLLAFTTIEPPFWPSTPRVEPCDVNLYIHQTEGHSYPHLDSYYLSSNYSLKVLGIKYQVVDSITSDAT